VGKTVWWAMSSLLRPPAIIEAISRGEATDGTLYALDSALDTSVEGRARSYPEHLAKPSTSSDSKGFNGSFDMPCPGYVTIGECESGHMFARELVCGREWCPHCGQTGGISHSRRKARWYPKGVQIRSMGYFVFTLPPELRWKYRSPKALSALGVAFRRMLQRHGYPRGLRGWDWFGEQENAPEGESPIWHPHYSALVDGAYLDKAKLKAIRQSVARILGVGLGRVNVYYQFSIDLSRKLHWLNYVTRPTFLDWRWDSEMAITLRGFRTYQAWGKWKGAPVWEVPSDSVDAPEPSVFALERGFCPSCGGELSWGKAREANLVSSPGWEGLGSGYWKYGGPHT